MAKLAKKIAKEMEEIERDDLRRDDPLGFFDDEDEDVGNGDEDDDVDENDDDIGDDEDEDDETDEEIDGDSDDEDDNGSDDEDNDDDSEIDLKAKTTKATTVTTPTSTTIPSPTPSPNPPPKSPAKPKPTGLEKIVLPSLPSYRLSFEGAKTWFDSLTSQQRSYVALYLYRLYPRIDRRLTDPRAQLNIDKPTAFNKDLIIAEHGGGKYKLTIGDVTGKRGKQIGEAHFEISMVKYPPKLNYEQLLVDEPSNKGYIERLKREGILDENGMPNVGNSRPTIIQQGTDPTMLNMMAGMFDRMMDKIDNEQLKRRDVSGEDHAVTKAIDMMAAAGEKNLEFVMNQARDSSPEKSMALISGIMGAISNLVPKSGNDMEMMKLIMTMQQNHTQMMVELMKTNKEQPQQNPGNGVGQMSEMLEFMTTAREFFGGSGAGGGSTGKKSTLETVLEHVGPAIPRTLDLISNIIAASAMRRGPMAQPQPGVAGTAGMTRTQLLQSDRNANPVGNVAQPGQTVGVGQYTVNRQGQNVESESTPVPEAETTHTEQTSTDPRVQAAIQVFAQYGGFFVNAVNEGKPGWELAEDVIRLAGRPIYKQIANVGPDILLTALQHFPEYWTQLTGTYGEAEITKFVQEFCNAEEILARQESGEDDSEEDDTAEVIVPKVVKLGPKKGKGN